MATYLDDFTAADNEFLIAGDYNDNWRAVGALGEFKVISNAATPNGLVSDSAARHVGALGANQYAQVAVTVTGTLGGGRGPGVGVRWSASAETGYRLAVDHAASSNIELGKFVGGSFSSLATRTLSWTDGAIWRLVVQTSGANAVLKIFCNGVQIGADVTDSSSPIASGSAALTYSSSVTSCSLDNFESGDLGNLAITNITDTAFVAASQIQATYGSAVTSGSTLVCGVISYTTDTTAANAYSVSDSVNGTWTSAGEVQLSTDLHWRCAHFFRENTGTGTPTVTAVVATGGAEIDLWIAEITGVPTSSVLDQSDIQAEHTTGSTTPSVASGTLAQADEIIIATVAVYSSAEHVKTPDPTYTQISEHHGGTSALPYNSQYKIVSSTASDTADWTLDTSEPWIALLFTLKAAAEGGGGGGAATQRDSDTFTYSNGNLATVSSGKWTALSGMVDCVVSSGSVVGSANNDNADVITNWTGSGTNQWSEVVVGTPTSFTSGPTVHSNGVDTFYLLGVIATGWQIYKAPTFDPVGSGASWTLVAGDTIRLAWQDGLLTASQNGTTLGTASDSTIASGRPGVFANKSNATPMASWAAGDYSTAALPPLRVLVGEPSGRIL